MFGILNSIFTKIASAVTTVLIAVSSVSAPTPSKIPTPVVVEEVKTQKSISQKSNPAKDGLMLPK